MDAPLARTTASFSDDLDALLNDIFYSISKFKHLYGFSDVSNVSLSTTPSDLANLLDFAKFFLGDHICPEDVDNTVVEPRHKKKQLHQKREEDNSMD